MTKAEKAIVKRNITTFEENDPETLDILIGINDPITSPVYDNDEIVNIDLGGGELYPKLAKEWTEDQLADFRENPDRLIFKDPRHCNLSGYSFKFFKPMQAYFADKRLQDEITAGPVVDIGFLFVFGVGLGYHLRELVETTPAKRIILIEPIAEFLLHSFSAIEWKDIYRIAKKRGIKIFTCLESKPEDILRFLEHTLGTVGNTFLDGSYYCPHYYSWTLKESYDQLQERIKHYFISSGFIEDEIGMMENTHRNIKDYDFHLLDGRKPYRAQEMPAFVVGSGPSIDKDLPMIKKWREQAIVFSCGTALRPLLSNGIKPDFHVELERDDVVPRGLNKMREEFDFSGITLITATTVPPEVMKMFDYRVYYFRASLSPAHLLSPGELLDYAEPMVSNSGYATSTALGFRNVYLFGVDCGQKGKGQHHSKDSLYFIDGFEDWDEECQNRYDRIVPGNFGGKAETFWAFDLSRRMISEGQRIMRANLFNCSDGAMIRGAQPKASAALDFSGIKIDRNTVVERLKKQMRFFEPGKILEEIDIDEQIEACEAFAEGFKAFTKDALKNDKGFFDFERRLLDFHDTHRGDYLPVFAMAGGTINSILRLGAFFGTRIESTRKRNAFFKFFVNQFEERCLDLADLCREALVGVKEGRPNLVGNKAIIVEQTAAE
jgi:hypothetical protein